MSARGHNVNNIPSFCDFGISSTFDAVLRYLPIFFFCGITIFVDIFCDIAVFRHPPMSPFVVMVKLFYTDISSSNQNNGWSSDFFPLSRGVRQGCPLCPYLFILSVETLGNAIRNHDQIKGISILDSECKISRYAR